MVLWLTWSEDRMEKSSGGLVITYRFDEASGELDVSRNLKETFTHDYTQIPLLPTYCIQEHASTSTKNTPNGNWNGLLLGLVFTTRREKRDFMCHGPFISVQKTQAAQKCELDQEGSHTKKSVTFLPFLCGNTLSGVGPQRNTRKHQTNTMLSGICTTVKV